MDAAKVLEGTTHSRSAGAPSSRLRRFHLPHWVNLLTHCGFYKYVVSMVSTIIYIIYPSSAFKTEYLAAVLNIYAVKAEDLLCWKKATGASNLLVEFAWKHGPQKGHTRCACVWSPNPEELLVKKRGRPKGTYLHCKLYHLTTAPDLFDFRQTTRTNKALGSKSG